MFPLLFAANESYLMWYLRALGGKNLLLLPTVAILSFVLTLILVSRGNSRFSGTAILVLIMLPMLAGAYGAIDSVIGAMIVLSRVGDEVTLKASEIADGIGSSLLALHTGITLAIPTILAAVIGLFYRGLAAEPAPAKA